MHANRISQTEKPKSRGTRRRLHLLSLAFLCFMGWAGLTWITQMDKVNIKLAQLATLENKMEETKQMNEHLNQEMLRLGEDEYIEQRARKDFHMIRPGDTLFITPKSEP